MSELLISNIINHRWHVVKCKGELSMGYDIIIGHDMMVKLVLMDDFKRQVLQQDGATAAMK